MKRCTSDAIIDTMSARPKDTSAHADDVQFELLRAMSLLQRAEILTALTFAVQELAMAGLRLVPRTLLTKAAPWSRTSRAEFL